MNEFEWAGVTPAAGTAVRVPRVAEAPVSFECKLQQIVVVKAGTGNGAAILGEVQAIRVRDDVYEKGYILPERLKPICRLAGAGYTRVTDLFEMPRVPLPVGREP